jgi:hypothetical protein
MTAASECLLDALPPLYSQEDQEDPIVHVKLSTPNDIWAAYLVEGKKRGDDYIVFGLFISASKTWGQVSFRKLEEALQSEGLSLIQDHDFTPAPLSQVTGLKRSRPVRKAS